MKSAINKLYHSLERKYVNRLDYNAFQSPDFFYLDLYPNLTCFALHAGNNYLFEQTENPYTDKKITLVKDNLFPYLSAFIPILFLLHPLKLS